MYSFSGNCAASVPISTFMCLCPNFHIHVSVSDLYSPRIFPHISYSRKGRPIVGIYNSLTDTWMWKLGLRPRYSFSGNICFKFSSFCLCSAEYSCPSTDQPEIVLTVLEIKCAAFPGLWKIIAPSEMCHQEGGGGAYRMFKTDAKGESKGTFEGVSFLL